MALKAAFELEPGPEGVFSSGATEDVCMASRLRSGGAAKCARAGSVALYVPAPSEAAERVTTQTSVRSAGIDDEGLTFADDDPTVSVADAARLLGRDRTR